MKTRAQEPAPSFVFGALRSGTTMFRLMLNSHPQITNPGEADFLFDHITPDPDNGASWTYDTEALKLSRIFRAAKLDLPAGLDGLALLGNMIAQYRARHDGVLTLNVHRNAAKIAQIFPQARIIHLVRDGRDVAYSSIGMGWAGNSYYGVDHWIETEQGWDKASAALRPENVLTLQFEGFLTDIEPHLRQVCDFLGVAFDPEMLNYHVGSSYGPPDPKTAQQWKRRAKPHDIALIEGKCAALLESRGYDLSGKPVMPGMAEKIYLALQHRVLRWRFNIRRLGLGLFVASAAARLTGSKTLQNRMLLRRQQVIERRLK